MNRLLRHITPLALGLAGLLLAARAQTVTTTWNGAASTSDFATPGNWSNGLPLYQGGTPMTVVGAINGGNTVTVTTAVTNGNSQLVDTLFVGDATNSTLDVQASGSLDALFLNIGNSAGETGTVTVSGTLRGGVPLGVGVDGNGTLEVFTGGVIKGPVNVAQNAGSTGSFTLHSGASILDDSEFNNSGSITGGDGNATIQLDGGSHVDGDLNLGGLGASTLTIGSGASFIGGGLYLQATSGGSVTGHLDGAAIGPSGILINGDGTNSLLVDHGATLTMTNLVTSEIGNFGTGSNSMTVSGAGTTWTNDGQLVLGGSAAGTLNISDSAAVSQQQLTMGSSTGGTGTLNLTTGGTLTLGNGYIGQADGGTGQVLIDGAGSDMHLTGDFVIGGAGNGSITVSGGGSLRNDGPALVGNTGSGSVTVTGSGSAWHSTGDVTLASGGGTGSITLTDGGQLTIGSAGGGHLYLNTAAAGFGTLNIGADAGSAAAAPGTLNAAEVSGSTSGSAVLVFNHTSGAYSFDPVITGGVFVVQKAGTTILTGANTYSGGNYVGGGTLGLGAHNALGSGDVSLDGGTIKLNGFNQASGILTVSSHSTINFDLAAATLTFANSSASAWSGSLSILNYNSAVDTLRFGTDAGGLTSTQLGLITINGNAVLIDTNGFLTAAAIPEPSTYALLAGLGALGLAAFRRHARRAGVTARL